jgi:sterol desaturase/sphingolipid hydroxylase (fatty acid hydroxylase superfamily)
MDTITIEVSLYSWLLFWLNYFVFGSLLSWYAHKEGIRKVTHLKTVLPVVLTNMLWTLPGILLLYFCPLRAWTDVHIIVKLILTYVVTEIWFYHFHLLIHHPQLYKKIHKLHHHDHMMQPFALTGLYCSPYEAIFLNLTAVSLGIIIFQVPAPYIYIWYSLVAINSVATHSGLYVPFFIDGTHDKHHKYQSTCYYGVSIYFDWIYGTLPSEEKEENKKDDDKNLGNFHLPELNLEK